MCCERGLWLNSVGLSWKGKVALEGLLDGRKEPSGLALSSFPMSFRILGFFPNNMGPITDLKASRYLASDQVILCMASLITYASLVAIYEGSSKDAESFLKRGISSLMSGLG